MSIVSLMSEHVVDPLPVHVERLVEALHDRLDERAIFTQIQYTLFDSVPGFAIFTHRFHIL
ncbi:MAG: hypothetical protein HYV07_14000 [Deltaproteobacteria bacterium]|nr:hypothetical protein [Deltaproteobacteria bacterium]